MASKKGTLNYKTGCGVLIKLECNDVFHAMHYNFAQTDRPQIHRCDSTHECKATFASATYEEEQELP